MEYAQQSIAAPQTMPELGRLKAATERVHKARVHIETFVDRFHGPMPEAATSGVAGGPSADSYRNDLESLFIQIERLEAVVNTLGSIG